MNDRELISGLREGSEKAYESLFSLYYVKLCLYAEHFLREKHSAREIVDDFFCELWMNSENIKIQSNLRAYLFSSIHNRCLKYLRHEKVKQEYANNQHYLFTDREILEPVSDEMPEAILFIRELEDKVAEAIEMLPSECRKIFTLSRFDDLSYQEIAQQLGISVNTVKTQMARALQKLRESLKEYLPD